MAYLDCDLGQPEFSPSGQVSLHIITETVLGADAPSKASVKSLISSTGPSFSHPREPYRAHFLGSVSPKSNPEGFVEAIVALLESFYLDVQFRDFANTSTQHSSRPIPLIINTQGWVKGLGADLLERISQHAKPTWIFTLQPDTPFEQQPPPSLDAPDCQHRVLSGVSPGDSRHKLSAADLRGISLLSYFHSTKTSENSVEWDTSKALGGCTPWEIDRSFLHSIIISGSDAHDVVEEEIDNALSASLVGLVRSDRDPTSSGDPLYARSRPLPSLASSECLGLALVRFASRDSSTFHLVTPVSGETLARCHTLVKGDLELPVWAYLDYDDGNVVEEDKEKIFGMEKSQIPFLQWTSGATGSSRRRVRRNVMRRGQM